MFHENFRTTNHTTSLEEFAIGNVCCNVSLSLLNGNGHNIQGMKITEYDRLMNIKSICDILIIQIKRDFRKSHQHHWRFCEFTTSGNAALAKSERSLATHH